MNANNKYLESIEKRMGELKKLIDLGLINKSNEFIPSIHYPPITRYPRSDEEEIFKTYSLPKDKRLDIYIHFPFCEHACTYCHYPGKLGLQTDEKKHYMEYLKKEIVLYMKKFDIKKFIPRSILIGGGTPTYLEPELLDDFLTFLGEKIEIEKCTQFNYDVDPNTIIGEEGLERLKIMKQHGVSRLTIGVQSLNDDILKHMNRPHTVKQAREAIDNARKYDFNVNAEFIYGYPGQTLENWIDCVNQMIDLPVDELQIYRLKILAYGDKQGAIINQKQEMSTFFEVMALKKVAIDIFNENSFYENLNRVFTKNKKHISHYAYNQCCNLFDQVGFGLTAFSSYRDRFALNTSSFDEYYSRIDQDKLPINRGYIRDKEEQLRWSVILPLKNMDIKKKLFYERNGLPLEQIFQAKFQLLKEYNLIEENNNRVKLTELGSFVADEVVQQFYSEEFIPSNPSNYCNGPLNPYNNNTKNDVFGVHGEKKDMKSLSFVINDNNDFPETFTKKEIKKLLLARGDLQKKLHLQAVSKRNEIFGNNLNVRGVIEISNICENNCSYCAMRRDNSKTERYHMDIEQVKLIAKSIRDSGIKTIFLQSGETPKVDSMINEIIPYIANDLHCEPLLCLGEKEADEYKEYKKLGAKSYILKFESSDERLHKNIRHSSLKENILNINHIKHAGLKLGTGSIIGLPNQSINSIVEDIMLSASLNPDFVSVSPFIANPGTPLEDYSNGDIDLTLNAIAILRLLLPGALIPSVSALEYIRTSGQLAGLNAGANVVTINFTPKNAQKKYSIYSKDRFIVELPYVEQLAGKANLKLNRCDI